MIHTNKNYFDYNLPALIEFGKGDIAVIPASATDHASLVLKNIEAQPIGTHLSDLLDEFKGKTVTDIQPEGMIIFTSSASVDVLIKALEIVKADLEKEGL